MQISYDWLKQFISTNKSAEEIGAMLTGAGLEVEGINRYDRIKGGLNGIVIGEVLTCEKHPDADKLNITTVDIGAGEPKQIVCGAANVAAGQKVVVATENAMLYPATGEPFKIKKSKIRGAASEGMICAEDEIGLGTSHDGIMVLDTDLPNGTPAAHYFDLASAQVFEIGLTPNRADAASHLGVSRDLQALLQTPIEVPDVSRFQVKNNSAPIEVEVRSPEACPRYAGVSMSGVKVGPSPEWLQHRLKSIGLSPINNVVDATNFVLHELGQPMHAFDADKIAGKKIIVQGATEGDKFVTLDGTERKLRSTDLMICNIDEPMVIAGVFGGKKAGVTEETTNIFLEAAYFSPESVRKTAMGHGIKTDSSFRFERGTDPEMVIFALKRTALLIQEIAGGEVTSEIVDVYPKPIENFRIALSIERVHKLIGQHIGAEKIKSILTGLEIEIENETETHLSVSVPPRKVDVQREADIVEEILRVYGYNNIELKADLSASYLSQFPNPDPEVLKSTVSNQLSAAGFYETMTNSLTDSKYYEAGETRDESLVRILNFNSEDLNVMRKTLVYSGLETLRRNINRKQKDLKTYEFGKVYWQENGKYKEQTQLVLFAAGNVQAENWRQPSSKTDFYELAETVQNILLKLNARSFTTKPTEHAYLADGIAYLKNDVVLAQIGLVNAAVAKQADVKETVWYAEMNWEYLTRNYKNKVVFEELPKFPEVRRDLSLVLDKTVSFEQVKQIAERTERKLLQEMNVFDVYEGDKIEAGKKAYAISFTLLDAQQTLTDKVIDSTMNRLMQQFEKQLGAVIRK